MYDYLLEKTGQSTAYWMARIETLIAQHSEPITDEAVRARLREADIDPDAHQANEPVRWLVQIGDELRHAMPVNATYDGNMWMAATMGQVLSIWFARLSYAKSHDPARPLADRRAGYRKHLEFVGALSLALVDEQQDPVFFPKQRWQHPHAGEARSGELR